MKNYSKLKNNPVVSFEALDQLARKYENNLNILGMIALREQLIHGAKEFVQFLSNSNINMFLLSGDGELSTINNLNNL